MNVSERITKVESTLFGNGKRGVLERIGRIEIMTAIMVTLNIAILVRLFVK